MRTTRCVGRARSFTTSSTKGEPIMWANDMMNSFFDHFEVMWKFVESRLRAGAEARLARQSLDALGAMATGLVASGGPLLEFAGEIARDEIAQSVERDIFDPVAAAEPARNLLQAYDALKRQGKVMLILA